MKKQKKRNKRNRNLKKKSFEEKIEKTEQLLENELKHRVSNRQPIYEINKNEFNWIKENIVHLKNYSRNFLTNKYKGICETEYEIDYLGKNVKQQFEKQKCKSNKNEFQIDKVKKKFIAVTSNINVEMREDPNIHIVENGKTGIALLLIASYCSDEEEEVIIDETCINKFK